MPSIQEGIKIRGEVRWKLTDRRGRVRAEGFNRNLVTAIGDQLYASRGLGLTTSTLPTGMRLGTGTTTPSKTGAGAAIVTYLSGGNRAFDGGFPAAAGGIATYQCTWAEGIATTASPINEVVINTDTIANNNATTATAANTICRALITDVPDKGATDILVIVWQHQLAGS